MLASCSGSPGGGASRAVTTISSGAGAKSEGATSDGDTFEGTTSEGGPPFDISSASGETEGTSLITGPRPAPSDRPRYRKADVAGQRGAVLCAHGGRRMHIKKK